jgi:monoamine oxidase
MSIGTNDLCVARFSAWVAKQRKQSFDRYRITLHRNLSAQRRQHLTQQAILDTAAVLFREALEMLYELPFDSRGVRVERGWSALTLRILEPFQGFCEALLDDALRFNRSSCAISNFAEEHLPSVDYQLEMRRELAAAWKDFALTANDLLVDTGSHAMASVAA